MEIRFANPIHPGEMLREEFMEPLKLSAGKLAKAIGVPRTRIERLVREETNLSLDTAVRLSRYFKLSEGFWMRMQTSYELDCLHANKKRLAALDKIEPLERPDLEGQEAA
ncbi:Antitoxin HigA [hydrothermal vent metagenome]|uniref:Antitoxin HigA n=1 Tax=hydrothermal vent metagenome TaxID=652676 RepID=A0A3B0R9X4_9ZZZZ